ncbi:hypothetical protein DAETH_32020 [Deinococcus aetherius]|uniref:Lipoprotein n=1 Tax=Deinococcus aetherius TaxID=200252 RepID=A0ABM8AHF7_9DEIO|nr:hypothetical protein [Deinococcus aetherius]BDP43233.1 hypothetical protein DAETH_32020 [Deinococcus aetherius]
MRPLALLLLPLTLTLAACGSRGVQAPGDYDLSGTIGGNWGTDPRLRLALVGTGFPSVVTNDGNQAQNVVSTGANTWNFGFDLPGIPSVAGVYQVVVYNDANNTGTYEIGESFARNRQWLIYSTFGGSVPAVTLPSGEEVTPAMTVDQGWNLYDRNYPLSDTNPRPASKVTGYDLSR